MSAYLERFKWFASCQQWKGGAWFINLSSLLTRNGLQVYTSMPLDQASDYGALKKVTLPAGRRIEVKKSKSERGETETEYIFQYMERDG